MSYTNELEHGHSVGFKTSLPRLPTLLTYNDNSYTKVKLALSLAERVQFLPWTDFDQKVADVKSQIDCFPACVTKQSKNILQRLRTTLDPLSAPVDDDSVKIEEFYRKRKRRLSGGMSFRNGVTKTFEADGGISNDGDGGNQAISDANNSLKGKLVFTCSSSCEDVNCKVFDVVQDLTRALTACRDLHIVSQLQVNSEFGRVYDVLSPKLSSGPSDHCTLIPDKALTLTTERPASSLPICAYELKGPLQFFWNAKSQVLPRSGTKKRPIPENEERTLANVNTVRGMPHAVQPIGRLVRTELEENYTAKGMSQFFNDVFKAQKSVLGKRQEDIGSHLFLRIAQAVSQALLTDSGCGVLYNHDEAVAFKVFDSSDSSTRNVVHDAEEPTQSVSVVDTVRGSVTSVKEQASSDAKGSQYQNEHKNGSLSVLVSRLYACDEEPSNVCALLAISTHSYNLVVGNPDKKLQVRASFQEATRTLVEQKTKQSEANKRGNSREPTYENSPDEKDGTGTNRSLATSDASYLMRLRPPNREDFDLTKYRTTAGDTVGSDSIHSSGSIASVHLEDRTITTEDDDPAFWKKMARVLSNNFGVIGHGATSVIIGSMFDGREVAVKSWNGVDDVGIYCLVNEIQVYRELHNQHSDALGVVIPQLRMSKLAPNEDATLVVDLVGFPVRRSHDGYLVTEENGLHNRLDVGDVKSICEAALKSLRTLHQSGVLHGDIDLKNLRIDREASEVAHKGWRVWWIDLGLAKRYVSDPIEYMTELAQCASLFPEACVDLSFKTV